MTFIVVSDLDGEEYTINVGNVSYIKEVCKGYEIHFKGSSEVVEVNEGDYLKFMSVVNKPSYRRKREEDR